MSTFTVSARKYRPGTFESVVGQEHVSKTLKNALRQQKLGQAFLFCGPRGVGKTTCARILAKALNCLNLHEDGEPCNECESCRNFAEQKSFNIYELDAASNNSVEDIRSLTDQVRFAPQSGRFKVYIIDEVHMLSQAAFNAFLKTLEEPPSYAIFILATTEKHKIIPTILSRCQIFDFHRIGLNDIVAQLKEIAAKEGVEAEPEALYVIAQKADGALRDALSIFDRVVSAAGKEMTYHSVISNLNILDYEFYFKVVDLVLDQDLPGTLLLFDDILQRGFDGQQFLDGLSSHFRNLLVCKDSSTLALLEASEDLQKRYLDQAAQARMSFILSALNILNTFEVNYKSARNPRLHVELALMKICYLGDAIRLGDELKNGEYIPAEKKKRQPEPQPVVVAPAAKSVQRNGSNGHTAKAVMPVEAVATACDLPKGQAEAVVEEPMIQQAPAPQPTAPKTNGKLSLDSIRAKVQMQKKEAESAAANAGEDTEPETFAAADPIQFLKAWEAYAEDLKERGQNALSTTVRQAIPEFSEQGAVVVKVRNKAMCNWLNEDKMHLQDLLASSFGMPRVKLDYKIELATEEEEQQYLSNPNKIFEVLSNENPQLIELQRRLDLRVDW